MQRTGKHAVSQSRRWPRVWLTICALPAAVVVLGAALSRFWPDLPALTPVLAVPPALAGIGAASRRRPVAFGVVMMFLAVSLIALGRAGLHAIAGTPPMAIITVLAIAFATVVSGIGASRSAQASASQMLMLADVTSVAEVTQRAV